MEKAFHVRVDGEISNHFWVFNIHELRNRFQCLACQPVNVYLLITKGKCKKGSSKVCVYYLREWLRVLHRGRGGRGDHCGGGAELRVLAPAAHRARTAGAPIAAKTTKYYISY